MFKRYNINELYLAYVIAYIPSKTSPGASYGYPTILMKNGENYIDLQNKDRIVTNTKTTTERCYVIYEIEPLSKHYTQDGRKINNFSRKKALIVNQQYRHVIFEKLDNKDRKVK